ncbi:MAG: hypothetical protein P8078_08680, partial [bacterium]
KTSTITYKLSIKFLLLITFEINSGGNPGERLQGGSLTNLSLYVSDRETLGDDREVDIFSPT